MPVWTVVNILCGSMNIRKRNLESVDMLSCMSSVLTWKPRDMRGTSIIEIRNWILSPSPGSCCWWLQEKKSLMSLLSWWNEAKAHHCWSCLEMIREGSNRNWDRSVAASCETASIASRYFMRETNQRDAWGKLTLFSSVSIDWGRGEQRMCTNCSEKWESMRKRSVLEDDATAGPRYSGDAGSSGKVRRKYFLLNLWAWSWKLDAIRFPLLRSTNCLQGCLPMSEKVRTRETGHEQGNPELAGISNAGMDSACLLASSNDKNLEETNML